MWTLMNFLAVFSGLSGLLFPEEAISAIIPTADDEGVDLFEGDILLTPDVIKFLLANQEPGQVANGPQATSSGHQNNAHRNRKGLWVTKVVPYEIPDSMKAEYVNTVNAAIQEYHKKSCLTFVKRTTETTWIKFVRKSGCWSSVGKRSSPGYQELSLGHGCNHKGVVIHELMHAVGFWHEQSRPDRDLYVEIFWENIKKDSQHNFNKYSHGMIDTLGVLYDYDSIMHYARDAFTVNGQDTIRPIKNPHQRLGQRIKLSAGDVVKLNALYDCKDGSSGVWSSWSGFSPCGSACDKYRQRFCSSHDRPLECPQADQHGIETEKEKCTDKECYAPVDGHWGRWSGWGHCSASCGPGFRQRTRTCNDPPASNGGKDCKGDKKQTRACKMRNCDLGPDDCDFEYEAGWCFWKKVVPGGPWYIESGPTGSAGTGPDGDHGGSDGGHYIYFESSSPLQPGDKGWVESKVFPPTNERCLTFYYYMFGHAMGSLNVLVRMKGSDKRLWGISGDQGQTWHKADISLVSDTNYKVIFEATKGSGFQSDIALDDISFKEELCSLPPTTDIPSTASPSKAPVTTRFSTTKVTTVTPTAEATTTTDNPTVTTQSTTTAPPTDRFLIYNADQDKCISVEGSRITARSCAIASPNKMWRWTRYGQLQNIFTLDCLTAPDPPQDWGRVTLAACDRNDTNQRWSCVGDFVRLNDTILNLNFGNVQGGDHVVLFQGTGVWSHWKVFGDDKNVCEKRQAVTTTQSLVTTEATTLPPSTSIPTTKIPTTMPTTSSPPVDRFSIYNADHDKCISVEGSRITARSCAIASPNKMWRWTRYGQLQSIFTLDCLTAPDPPQDWGRVTLAACDRDNANQKWSCVGDFVRLNDTILNLNFGNIQGGDHVVLFQGTGVWSQWKVFGDDKNICEKRKVLTSRTKSPSPAKSTPPSSIRSKPTTDLSTTEPTTQFPPVDQFLIHNTFHNKCVAIQSSIVTATSCDPASPNKLWRWTQYNQLQSIFTLECLTVSDTPQNWVPVELAACDRNNANQVWSCLDEFLRLSNTILNLNYGNTGDEVVLYQGTGPWSKWKVFGEDENVCVKRKGT